MIFKDIHCGFYTAKQPLQYACTHDEVARVSEACGIVKRAIFNREPDFDTNLATRAFAAASGGAETPVYRLLPPVFPENSFTREQMETAIRQEGALFRVMPKSHSVPFTPWVYDWCLDLLTETRTPLLVTMSEIDLRDAAEVKRAFPELRLVLTNTSQNRNREYVSFAKYFPHVYMETSCTVEYQGLENMSRILGAEHFLFGTNMPLKEPYDKIQQVLFCGLSQEEKELIAHGNYERLVERREP